MNRAGLGPATSADLLELDAVPEPIDSAAPAATYLPGCKPVGPSAETRPIRAVVHHCPVHGKPGFCNEISWAADDALGEDREFPTRDAVEQALRDAGIEAAGTKLSTAKCGWCAPLTDDIHARTLARART